MGVGAQRSNRPPHVVAIAVYNLYDPVAGELAIAADRGGTAEVDESPDVTLGLCLVLEVEEVLLEDVELYPEDLPHVGTGRDEAWPVLGRHAVCLEWQGIQAQPDRGAA
ncbi:MAG TPA: hypothetical protein VFC19_30800 [Candidatus Limnocylindrales bacterium]|nr:hypothetical protein [Candidatus Limnocylindrales bacterium]